MMSSPGIDLLAYDLLAYIGPGIGFRSSNFLEDFFWSFLFSLPTLLLVLLALVPFSYLFVLLGRFFLRLGYGVANIH